ncbi:AcrR family transcriptional regulator [Variovorax boronicumulans]|uniref:TetR/AcrR family transcriptional regulator n=1 Tax=Variovorax boronicumulans TaxID=436515 RepID=UPI0027880EF7|nr:TetR/AcrR family transcriptional regulator [Variovorax boronicumulans]MDP9996032.1 AcrR family transcriptional regulator [Variovorax boronicumulans]MDQ0007152.1 AcrR family transcriptional regulator [Variovorax boronicumulans]
MTTAASAPAKPSFKEQMLQAREEAIVQTANRLLAEKGFESMTVDEVAASVGIAKASLYKHFPSKEDLAAAAMVRLMQRTQDVLASVQVDQKPIDKLRAVARWSMEAQLAGEMPSLPHQNSSLRAALMNNRGYLDRLVAISDTLGGWIQAAQADGTLNPKLPAIAVLYTLFARACDPVLGFLKSSGLQSDAEIVDLVLGTCFDGLASR